MKKVEASVARKAFSETLNSVAYGHKRVVVSRHGKDVAAIVPLSDLDLIDECEDDGEVVTAARPRPSTGQRRRPKPARRSTRRAKR